MVVMVVIVVAVAMTADIHLDARVVIVGQLGRRAGHHGSLLVLLAQVDPPVVQMTQPTRTAPRTRGGGRGTRGGSGYRGETIRMAQRWRRPGSKKYINEQCCQFACSSVSK